MGEVRVTVSGPVGCGKSAIAGEIEIALTAIGVPVRYANPVAERQEKHLTRADWQSALDHYKPSVVIEETFVRSSNGSVKNGCFSQRSDGTWEEAIPLPFYWGFLPWMWKRLTGWRDEYNRPAQFIGWR